MQKHVCDICGLEVGQYELSKLFDYYQTAEVKEVCSSCYSKVNQIVQNIEDVTVPVKRSWVKRLISKMRVSK